MHPISHSLVAGREYLASEYLKEVPEKIREKIMKPKTVKTQSSKDRLMFWTVGENQTIAAVKTPYTGSWGDASHGDQPTTSFRVSAIVSLIVDTQ